MSDILNYKFYLNFKNEGGFGRIEITEPFGFDGMSMNISQTDYYGRDAYRISEEISLEFHEGFWDDAETPIQLPNGNIIYHLTQGYEHIIETYKKHGFESDVDFEIELDGVVFIPSNLDFYTSEWDGYSKFVCEAVQESSKQIFKRRTDLTTDIFSKEDLDGNSVDPAVTENILLRAKPVVQVSEWETSINQSFFHPFLGGGGGEVFYNANLPIIKSGIDDTLSYLPFYSSNENEIGNLGFVDAVDDLIDFTFTIKLTGSFEKLYGTFTNNPGSGIRLRYGVIEDIEDPINTNIVPFVTSWLNGNGWEISNSNEYIDIDFEVSKTISVPRGYRFILYLEQNTAFLGGGNTELKINTYSVSIKATSIGIDTVIKGVRYIDVFKENAKRINGSTVFAPRYDVGGEYYDQYAFTGNLIKQRDDVAFSVNFDDLADDLIELNSGYQLTDNVNILQYQDFYPNNEIAAFYTLPSSDSNTYFNERYAINEFNYKYSNYETDDDEENTTDSIHTDTQWFPYNKQVENDKSIDIKLIRDAYKISKLQKDASKETTSTDDDDKMAVIDVVPLSPTARGGFSANMTHNIDDDGNVQLLKDSDLPSWAVLGFTVGGTFSIDSEDNNGEYEVFEIEDTIITLTPINPTTQSFDGESFTKVEYDFNNVAYVNRTSEGLEYYENLLNGDNYANLKYSIKRNLKTWEQYIATASLYNPDRSLKNTYFKSNGDCTTRFEWEDDNVIESADIINSDLPEPLLTPLVYELKLTVPFKDMKYVIDLVNTINSDNTIGGFIRCVDSNGKVLKLYPKELDYTPSNEMLSIVGEERYEGKGVDIVIDGSDVIINRVGYSEEQLQDVWYEFNGDYLKIFDNNHLPIIEPTKYDEVTVDGLVFESAVLLSEYLYNA